jgi:predicted dehydrogenase
MINAAIVGLGWWGKTLVESVQDSSCEIRFIAGAMRTKTPEIQAFAEAQKLELADSYETLLTNPKVNAVVLATPHSRIRARLDGSSRTTGYREYAASGDRETECHQSQT